jgi:DNA-binding response OmpR family regulator
MPPVTDLCVKVVEDDALLAMHLSAMLSEQGYRVLGPFTSLRPALAALEAGMPDAAVLDIDLNGVMSFPISDALAGANVPFLWLSGSSRSMLPERHRGHPFLPKTVEPQALLSAVAQHLNRK